MLNARLRAANLAGVPVAAVGEEYDLTYPVEQLGAGADALDKLAKNRCACRRGWLLRRLRAGAGVAGMFVLCDCMCYTCLVAC